MKPIKLSCLFLFLLHGVSHAAVNDYFARIKEKPNALYTFLKKMPKGGELHYHLAGGSYPEEMLAIAAQGDYCVDKKTFEITKSIEHCSGISAKELIRDPRLYDQTVRAWSLKDFTAGKESTHDHFFASFHKFHPLIYDHTQLFIAEVMQRAVNQNELYLEIMIMPDKGSSTAFAPAKISPEQFSNVHQQLLVNPKFIKNINYTVQRSARILKRVKQYLNCDNNPTQDVCQITVKFQYHVLREQPLEKVFVQAVTAFAAASLSPDLVGVNLVQAEDGILSLRDYRQQMQVFGFLHQVYPKVHIALHAGELAPSTSAVTPEDLRFHIYDAVTIGQAERIGHGVDIAFEDEAEKLFELMAKKRTVVEINLVSNKQLLNVAGKHHPLNDYLSHQVPVILSTDDEGILRTDLTRQYLEAVLNHGLDYSTLKTISRNALTYSFLPGESLWQNSDLLVKECTNLDSQSCLDFVKKNEKARLQRTLEKKFIQFENNY